MSTTIVMLDWVGITRVRPRKLHAVWNLIWLVVILGLLRAAYHAIQTKQEANTKLILGWHPLFVPDGPVLFEKLGCKVKSCSITYQRDLLRESDAVLVRVAQGTAPAERPSPIQRWVFVSHEPPVHPRLHHIYTDTTLQHAFNWTMTYRQDSDIYFPFGDDLSCKETQQPGPPTRDLLAALSSKPKLAVWIASKCNSTSKREFYVKELRKYISVDIYGKCGHKMPFPNTKAIDKDIQNMEMINKTYIFYLAFENSLCEDYVTEKFYKMLPYDVIPVVRGGANLSSIIPHRWYIDSRDFQTPRLLATHLLDLQRHPQKMLKHFENKHNFAFDITLWRENKAFCTLCEKLNDDDEPAHVYPDIANWFLSNSCHDATDILM